MPSEPGVSTISAPYAAASLRRSMDIVSGIVRMRWYPFTAETSASPTPVLPLVGSMIVAPGLSVPSFSAAAIIAAAMRSFTLPPGLKNSTFTSTFAPPLFVRSDSSTSGVPPTFSRMLL